MMTFLARNWDIKTHSDHVALGRASDIRTHLAVLFRVEEFEMFDKTLIDFDVAGAFEVDQKTENKKRKFLFDCICLERVH